MINTSTKRTFEGFELSKFILGFKKPAIMLLTFAVTTLMQYPELTGIVTFLGGTGVLVERIWAIVEFYFKEVQL